MAIPPPATASPAVSVDQLPPEALALATRLFEAARNGQMDLLDQALRGGLKPNMTNGKGDSLVSSYIFFSRLKCFVPTSVARGFKQSRLNTLRQLIKMSCKR